jgi:hypothetical protein
LARRLADDLRRVRLSADEWITVFGVNRHDRAATRKVETLQWNLAEQLLRLGERLPSRLSWVTAWNRGR